MKLAIIYAAGLTACLPAPSVVSIAHCAKVDPTARASELCSRRIAQLAAPYNPKGTTTVVEDAGPTADGGYRVALTVTIDYGDEKRQTVVDCVVSPGGRIESIEGWN